MHLFQQIHEPICCWQCFLLSPLIDLGLILHWKVGLSYTAHLTDRCKTIFSYTTKKKQFGFQDIKGRVAKTCRPCRPVGAIFFWVIMWFTSRMGNVSTIKVVLEFWFGHSKCELIQPMSLSGDKGVAQFKKSVKMGHPIQ